MKHEARRASKSPREICEAIHAKQFELIISNGCTVVETSDAGGSTRLDFTEVLSAKHLAELCSAALDHIESCPDPDNPTLPQEITRLRVCFNRASL